MSSSHNHTSGANVAASGGHHRDMEVPGEHGDHSEHADHGGHDHGDHVAEYRKLFGVMLLLGLPVVATSPGFAMLFGYQVPGWATWIAPILGTVMYVWGGQPFLVGALSELKARKPGMMLLISLAITVAFLSSWGATLGLIDHQLDFWWELALLIVIMLLGHWVEMRSLAQTSSALDSLATLLPDEAEVIEGEEIRLVSPADLRVGDVVVVRPGGSIPADGNVIAGSAYVDESMITGESKPVFRTEGSFVVAGTLATDSGIRVQVSAVGEETTLAGIQQLVEKAQSSSSRAQRLADRAASWLFWYALIAAGITAAVWLILGFPDDAVTRTITVLVIACPHALGLAIPLVISIATERAAVAGVLIKDRLALESMRTVGVVVFDKTGTLTEGRPQVTGFEAAPGRTPKQVLALAAAAEMESEHPLGIAIVEAARQRSLDIPMATNFSSSPAVGVQATVGTEVIQVGGPYLLKQEGQQPLAENNFQSEEGATILHVLAGGKVIGALTVTDKIRPESAEAVRALQERDIEVVMITGDAEAVAQKVSAELGIKRYFAGVRPEDKATKVAALQDEGLAVAMVGDGVNDAPALAQADVGIAIGAGTEVAIASAGVILASDDPRAVISVRVLSKATYRKMQQNLWWAAGYNLMAVPLAAGVLAPVGFVLPMSVGAILMSASTVIVALNAQLLRRLNLNPNRVIADR